MGTSASDRPSSPARRRVSTSRVILLVVIAIVLSAAYVGVVNLAVTHQPNRPVVGWTDSRFSGNWRVATSNGTSGYLSIFNGTLTVGASGIVEPGAVVLAQSSSLPTFDLAHYPFLSVTVRSPSEFLAIRLVLWTSPTDSYLIVLSTFQDSGWHTIYANLPSLIGGSSGPISPSLIELGWTVVQQPVGPNPSVEFQNLSLVAFSGG